MDGWNISFLLGWPIFRCYVSFRECTVISKFPESAFASIVSLRCLFHSFPLGVASYMLHGTGIFAYIWLKFMVSVGKYSNPMEHMAVYHHQNYPGNVVGTCWPFLHSFDLLLRMGRGTWRFWSGVYRERYKLHPPKCQPSDPKKISPCLGNP